ncbi:MAG: formylmethanofuran dehydrogenase [Chloroflexi bacterium]|nr:formylmethanofuran dehydrogenase [Chloroflexota bacterium]
MSCPPPALMELLLAQSAQQHKHLCPRQVLGVRIGLCGLLALGLIDHTYAPQFNNNRKRLLTIVETDGCGADGIAVATDCHVGRRTMRVMDYGKVAATLVDQLTETAVRVSPSPHARILAEKYAPDAKSRWHAYLKAYQFMPENDLLCIKKVKLVQSLAQIMSRPNKKVLCATCGEEIMNERELLIEGQFLCRTCSGDSYYINL